MESEQGKIHTDIDEGATGIGALDGLNDMVYPSTREGNRTSNGC